MIGPFADNKLYMYGNWAPKVHPEHSQSIKDGLAQLSDEITYTDGCKSSQCLAVSTDNVEKAVSGSELVIVCLGTSKKEEKEANDRTSLNLPGKQLDLLKHVVKHGE